MRLPLLALAVCAFGIGTTEFVIMGLLPEVASSLGTSIPGAGLLVTGYALAVTLGSPVVALATARRPRKATLIGLMCVFILGNLLCALAPTYRLLMGARVVTALAHGAFFGIGSVVATQLVPRSQRAQAIALMFAGLTLANVLGVPLGTMLGQAAGWRATFWAVSGIGVAAVAALALLVPDVPAAADTDLLGEFRTLRRPQVLMAMAMSVLSSVSLFATFTFITPLLEQVTRLSPHAVSLVLLVFGVGITLGNLLGGRLADWRLMPSVVALFGALSCILLLFHAALPVPGAAVAVLAAWGAASFALGAPLQVRVVDEATDAPNLAATLNQGAFNLGNATGAWMGGAAITAGWSYHDLPVLSAGVAVLGMVLAAVALLAERTAGLAASPGA